LPLSKALDADERAAAIHEAGHAVVAHALGADVSFVEMDVGTGNGASCSEKLGDNSKTVAILVSGYKAELAFSAHELNLSKMFAAHAVRPTRDYQQMQELLLRLPELERLPTLVEGFMLADEKLKANGDVVNRIANALFARRREDKTRIEGAELDGLLAVGASLSDLRGMSCPKVGHLALDAGKKKPAGVNRRDRSGNNNQRNFRKLNDGNTKCWLIAK
jgi:hypothetical protein